MLISGRNYSLDSRIDLEIPVTDAGDHGRPAAIFSLKVESSFCISNGTFVTTYQVLPALTKKA